MRLKVLTPTGMAVDQDVTKVKAEAVNGAFCLLPRHIDFVAPLVPGLLSFESGGRESVVAVDTGVLVKCGDEVRVSVRSAVQGTELSALKKTVDEQYETLDDRERKARSALARLEAHFVNQFIGMQQRE